MILKVKGYCSLALKQSEDLDVVRDRHFYRIGGEIEDFILEKSPTQVSTVCVTKHCRPARPTFCDIRAEASCIINILC